MGAGSMTSILEKTARRRCLMDCMKNCESKSDCTGWQTWEDDTRKQIMCFLAAAAGSGWHMRPDEATEEMVTARMEVWQENAWPAMLAAAPKFEWDK